MTKIKICGLRRLEDVSYVNELVPDFIGFVFASDRKRYIEPVKAKELKKALKPEISSVGVFVDEKIEKVLEIAESGVMDIIQLHGHEGEEYIERLRTDCGIPIIKAFRIEKSEDIKKALDSPADFILFDNGIGGTGRSFDWSLIKNADRPFFLAGGLTAQNVGHAIKLCAPFAVDISSGVETDGAKDYDKIKEFIEAVRKDT